VTIRICTLGRVRGLIDDKELKDLPGQRLRCALLLHLAVERESTREALCNLFWQDRDEEKARRALTQMLYELRRTFGEDWVEARSDLLRVGKSIETDALEFARAAEQGALEHALELYRGPFVSDFYLPECMPFESWVDRKRASLARVHRTLRRERVKQLLETGDVSGALDVVRDWVELEPLEDEAQHRLIELLALKGDRAEALRQYEIYERALKTQELEPLTETIELVRRIREGSALGEAQELAAAKAPRARSVPSPAQNGQEPRAHAHRGGDLPAPVASYNTIINAARKAADAGYWRFPEPITDAVDSHVLEFVSRIVSADGHVSKPELEIFDQVLPPDLLQQDESTLRTIVAVKLASRTLNDFLGEVPEYLRAILTLDLAERTQASQAAGFALLALGLHTAAVDGLASEKEVLLVTEYTQNLFRFISAAGVEERPGAPAPDNGPAGVDTVYPADQLPQDFDQLLATLHRMVGLDRVKREVDTLTNLVRFRQLRAERGLPELMVHLHLIFTGNPGTGQTTVARLLGGIFRELGILSQGQLVEIDGASFVGRAASQAVGKVNEVVQKAKGGILFIDDASSLAASRGAMDSGTQAVNALLKAMDEPDLVVIFAGYPASIEKLLQAYPKLRARFSHYIHFDDYDPAQMVEIFERLCEDHGYHITAAARQKLSTLFELLHGHRDLRFANARDVRNIFERIVSNHANRVMHAGVTADVMSTIDVPDLPKEMFTFA
jgi:stage V sporulation protein K